MADRASSSSSKFCPSTTPSPLLVNGTEEVLSRQNQHTQDFLLQTSILDRLTAPLCDAVVGRPGSQNVLEALDRANLFLVPLDHERCWFRYHHLFAELLRQKLRVGQPGAVPELHQRASLWFEQEVMSSDAIRHALAARAFGRAAELAEENDRIVVFGSFHTVAAVVRSMRAGCQGLVKYRGEQAQMSDQSEQRSRLAVQQISS